MTKFKITDNINDSIRAALFVINHYCEYEPIWTLSPDNTISKVNPENLSASDIAAPTSLQINDLAFQLLGDNSSGYKSTNFLTFISHLSFYFPDANIYEIMLIGLANLAKGINKNYKLETQLED